jgi:hypothetical protein
MEISGDVFHYGIQPKNRESKNRADRSYGCEPLFFDDKENDGEFSSCRHSPPFPSPLIFDKDKGSDYEQKGSRNPTPEDQVDGRRLFHLFCHKAHPFGFLTKVFAHECCR